MEQNTLQLNTREEVDIFVRQVLNIGEAMYRSGSEISRIEDSLHRLGKAYGTDHMSIYALTSDIVVTVEFPGHHALTQSRRIQGRESLDLKKLEKLNSLIRSCCKNPMPVDQLRAKVLAILEEKPKQWAILLGYVIASGAFAVFFGGEWYDAVVAGFVGLLIFMLQTYFQPVCSGRMFYNAVASFLSGCFALLCCHFFPMLHGDMIMIGDIMVLIPGVAITNSIRYTLSGDSISGFEKLVDSLLQAMVIAAGFSLAVLLWKGGF